jgi:enediyne biosynthesis protein E4
MSHAGTETTMPAIEDKTRTEPESGKRRSGLVLGMAIAVALLIWGGWKWWEVRHYRRAMARIEEEIDQGLPARAASDLIDLLARDPDSDEAAYWLGACEKMRGRPQAAALAWAKVPPSSTFWPRSTVGRMSLEIDRGRLAAAEQLIKNLNRDSPSEESDPSILLGSIYCYQGRVEEAKRLIETRWDHLNEAGEGAAEKAINLLRLYTEIQSRAMPVEVVRDFLDHAALGSPDDDRIWLGRANLAVRAGSYDEAARWLDACLRSRPDDVAVWRAWLDRGLAANDVEAVKRALTHLPASGSTSAEVHRLAAWFAARRGDVEVEVRALERLVDTDPSDFQGWDRLAELAKTQGQQGRADELRQKKMEIVRLQTRYQKLHERHQPKRDSVEMARLAGLLGRRFEAKALLAIAVSVYPDRKDLRLELARLENRSQITGRPGNALADLLAPELDEHRQPSVHLTPDRADP